MNDAVSVYTVDPTDPLEDLGDGLTCAQPGEAKPPLAHPQIARETCDRSGVIVRTSRSGFAETMSALVSAIERRGLTVFARIDHAAGARDTGLELEDEQVLVFGNPATGTPLMQADRRVGIELPLRILVWREAGEVRIGYNDPRQLSRSYDVERHSNTLEQMAGLLHTLSSEASDDPT